MRLAALAAATVLVVAGCSSEQDPEIVPAGSGGPSTTSALLQPCPPDGPDDTTASAGCLDPDGKVLRP